MAGPHVSGVVALLKQVNAGLTVDEIEEILANTATPLTDSTYPQSPNNGYGVGLVNAFDAVSSIANGLGKIKGTVTEEGTDTEGPSIESEPVTSSYKGMDLAVQATVSDNISITEVTIAYKKADGSWGEFNADRISGDYKSGQYEAVIPGSELTGDTTEYRFTATDFGGNTAESDTYAVELLNGISVGYETDFEQNPTGWTTYGTKNSWQWGIPASGPEAAASGEKVYATNLAGNYDNSANMSLQMPPVDLPEGESFLQFKHWYNPVSYTHLTLPTMAVV